LWSTFRNVQVSAPYEVIIQMLHFTTCSFFLKFKSILVVKKLFSLLIAAFATATLDLICRIYFISFVIVLRKQLKYSTFSGLYLSILGMVALFGMKVIYKTK
jgi:hypothetical protein